MILSRRLPHDSCWTNETVNAYYPAFNKKPGYLSHPADIFMAVLISKSKICINPGSQLVPIQGLC